MSNHQAESAEVTPEEVAAVSTPPRIETPWGAFEFFDGMPLPGTVDRSWDTLDLIRAVDVFLNAMPGASMVAMRTGFRSIGGDANHKLIYTDPKADSSQIVLTANTVTTYGTNYIDLSDGPVVIEVPPNSLSFVDDIWQRYVTDMGNAGEDRGAGGKYLLLPPGFDGEVPDGYYVRQSRTFSNWLVIRALGGVADLLTTRIYSLASADSPPEMEFINMARASFIGVHANDASFYDEVNSIVQNEPLGALDPERAGQIAALGIVKGAAFEPDERMRGILDAGARIGGAIARSLAYKPRDPAVYYYPGESSWKMPFVGGSHEFLHDGARLLDARALMQYIGTGITPAMAIARVGIGSQYAYTAEDADGAWLDGGKRYALRLPAGIPAKTFWSIDIYDPQSRSLLQTSNPWPSINSFYGDVPAEPNGDTLIHFSPERGDEENWIETIPGKGWFVILRLYGPLDAWFDKTWRPGEITLVASE